MSQPDVSQRFVVSAENNQSWSNISSDLWVNKACTGLPGDGSGRGICAPSDVLQAPGTVGLTSLDQRAFPITPIVAPAPAYYYSNEASKGHTKNPWYTFGLGDHFESHVPGDTDPHKVLREVEWASIYAATTALNIWVGLKCKSPIGSMVWGAITAMNIGHTVDNFRDAYTDYQFNQRAEKS